MPSFTDALQEASKSGATARDAIRRGLAASKPSFASYARDSAAKGISARDILKAYRDSTGSFLVGETEKIDRKVKHPLTDCSCGGHK